MPSPILVRRVQPAPRAVLAAEYAVNGYFGGVTTARTTALWLPDATPTYQQYGNGEVGIIDGDAIWCQPAATNYTDGTDDLTGGPETVDLTAAGTGNYTLSVIGTAAVTVAAGTAVGTGFGQATEGSPVTFNLSSAGTVTLTLDSGSLDIIGSSVAKQIEKNAFASSFIPTPAGTPVTINRTQPVVPWPSGLETDFVLSVDFYHDAYAEVSQRVFEVINDAKMTLFDLTMPSSSTLATRTRLSGTTLAFVISSDLGSLIGAWFNYKCHFSSQNGWKGYLDNTEVLSMSDTTPLPDLTDFALGYRLELNSLRMLGRIKNARIIKLQRNATPAEVLAL